MFGLFDVDSPGLGKVPKGAFQDVLQGFSTSNLNPGERSLGRLSNLFGTALSTGTDPAGAAFEAMMLANQYPGVKTFQPGGKVWGQAFKERYRPQSKNEAITDANYMYQTVLGRQMNPEEKQYVKKERPTSQQLAGLLYSNPESALAASPTAEEDRISAYYGRMVPSRSPSGGVQYTGKRFSSIEPVAFTGGIS